MPPSAWLSEHPRTAYSQEPAACSAPYSAPSGAAREASRLGGLSLPGRKASREQNGPTHLALPYLFIYFGGVSFNDKENILTFKDNI